MTSRICVVHNTQEAATYISTIMPLCTNCTCLQTMRNVLKDYFFLIYVNQVTKV